MTLRAWIRRWLDDGDEVDRAIRRVRERHGIALTRDDPLSIMPTMVAEYNAYGQAQLLRWAAGVFAGACLLLALVGWACWSSGYRAAQRDSDMLQSTAQGQAALWLAKQGYAADLARCRGPGWVLEKGQCVTMPVNGFYYGWPAKED